MTTEQGQVTIERATTTGTLMAEHHNTASRQRADTEVATMENSTTRVAPLKTHTTNVPFLSMSIKNLLLITINIKYYIFLSMVHIHTFVFVLLFFY